MISSQNRIYYFVTPEGKRMSYALLGPFIDVKDLNLTPNISEQQARQVLADYLHVERDDNWACQLGISEYSTKKDGKILRDIRLVYGVVGPYAPAESGVNYFMAPRYSAEIDAHTGELVFMFPDIYM